MNKSELEFDEPDLLERIASGDRKAYSILYNQYLGGLSRYIYLFSKSKETSEEIVQDIFIMIWEKRETLTSINSFKSYLYRSAKNLLLDEIRKNQVKAKAAVILKPQTEESHEKADERLIYDEYYKIAEKAIELLPEKRKRIFLLRTREELSLDEIAEQLAISKSVVKKQLYAGISFVRKYMQQHGIQVSVILVNIFLELLSGIK